MTRVTTSFACALSLLAGCGGNGPLKPTGAAGSSAGSGGVAETGGGGTTGSAGAGGAAASAGAGPCPTQPPTAATSCTVADLICEYGTDPNPYCRTYARCPQGQWQLAAISTTLCPSTKASSCPATLEAARDAACTEKDAWCSWGPGLACLCTDCRPGPAQARCTGNPTWDCPQSSTDCPIAIPRAGTPFSGNPVYCDYQCEFGARRCVDGSWAEDYSPAPCPRAR